MAEINKICTTVASSVVNSIKSQNERTANFIGDYSIPGRMYVHDENIVTAHDNMVKAQAEGIASFIGDKTTLGRMYVHDENCLTALKNSFKALF